MNKVVSILSIAAFAVVVAQADQAIKFSNAAADVGANKLVTFDGTFGAALAGKGVVNNAPGNAASYVAGLFTASGTQIGATAAFRVPTTSNPGTWSGGTRTLAGVAQGTELSLIVKVWDAAFPTLDAAKAAGKGWGQSTQPFSFKDPLSQPTSPNDTLMVNFSGFSITQVPEPSTYALAALGVAGLIFLRRK